MSGRGTRSPGRARLPGSGSVRKVDRDAGFCWRVLLAVDGRHYAPIIAAVTLEEAVAAAKAALDLDGDLEFVVPEQLHPMTVHVVEGFHASRRRRRAA